MQTDILVIGAGIAGATAALRIAQETPHQVLLLTRSTDPLESSSQWAQGGIVGRGFEDTSGELIQDVLAAGAGLSSPAAVEILAEEGPKLLAEILIQDAGVRFDQDESGKFILGMEAAHSHRRILHVGDATGAAIMAALHDQIAKEPNIQLLSGVTAVDLITDPHHARDPLAIYDLPICHGAYIFNQETSEVEPILARATILATGGLGQIYLNTTNPSGARGDGLAMAYRAGARIINSEYIQFHPTALHMPGATKFLISEAVRGEGGVLLTREGDPFMERYAPKWKELAPRDVVARAIYWEMVANDSPFVLLDIASHGTPAGIQKRFPKIYKTCLSHGIDITAQPIPVVPAAHYFCGGVLVDLWGRTSLPGLYAVGEVSCTGVHGANRLASTSLLEGLVWGDRTTRYIRTHSLPEPPSIASFRPWDLSKLEFEVDPALVQGDMQTIRNLMWHYVGLVRSEYRLHRAMRELRHLRFEIEEFYRKTRLTDNLIGLRNAVQTAQLVVGSARRNQQSRGAHYREDSEPLQDRLFQDD